MRPWVVVLAAAAIANSAQAAIVTDHFDGSTLGTAWQVVEQTGGASWNESGGTLNVGGHIGYQGGLVFRYNQAIGDVGSVSIDYNWISYTGHKARVGLGLFGFDSYWDGNSIGTSQGAYVKGVRYQSSGLHAVDGGTGGTGEGVDYHIAYSVPTTGSLKIERSGDDFRVSYLQSGNWQLLFDAQHDFGGTPLYPYLFTSNSNTNPGWQVALDNFSLSTTAPVPEPSSLVLWSSLGVVGLAAMWRRRRLTIQ